MRSSSRSASGNTGGHCTALSPATCRRSSTSSAVCRLRAPHSKCGSISASAYRECDERTFSPSPPKRYYREYNCTLRSRLGSIDGRQELCFDLRKQPSQLLNQILPDVLTKVLPVYDVLSSREAILAHRRDYPHFDVMGRQLILLDEAMICGHLGDLEKAQALFAQYYLNAVHAYQREKAHGKQVYLQKEERVICHGQNITADKTGYFTILQCGCPATSVIWPSWPKDSAFRSRILRHKQE